MTLCLFQPRLLVAWSHETSGMNYMPVTTLFRRLAYSSCLFVFQTNAMMTTLPAHSLSLKIEPIADFFPPSPTNGVSLSERARALPCRLDTVLHRTVNVNQPHFRHALIYRQAPPCIQYIMSIDSSSALMRIIGAMTLLSTFLCGKGSTLNEKRLKIEDARF